MKKLKKGKLRQLKPKSLDGENTTLRWSEAYTDYLRTECHLAENTVMAYTRDMRRFTYWLGKRRINGLTIAELSDFVGYLGSQNLAPTSIARHIVAVKMFFRYLQLEGVLVDNKVELLGSQKLWQRVPSVLSPREVERFLHGPKRIETYHYRDRATSGNAVRHRLPGFRGLQLAFTGSPPQRTILQMSGQGQQATDGSAGRRCHRIRLGLS